MWRGSSLSVRGQQVNEYLAGLARLTVGAPAIAVKVGTHRPTAIRAGPPDAPQQCRVRDPRSWALPSSDPHSNQPRESYQPSVWRALIGHDDQWSPGPTARQGPRRERAGAPMTQQRSDYDRGLSMVRSASSALDAAELEYWFFGGWAVDLWVGRLTRPHDDIDVLVWRHDEARVHEALQGAGWTHTPSPEDRVGTNYVRDGHELQLTFAVPGPDGGVTVPVPEQPLVLSSGPLAFVRRDLQDASVRVLTLEMMLAHKATPRPDEVGGGKDRADFEALRSVTESSS